MPGRKLHRSTLARGLTVALAVACVSALSAAGAAALPVEPQNDPFYTQPNPMPNVPVGTVLSSRPFDVSILGLPSTVHGYQVAYASTNGSGTPVMDVTTILLPNTSSRTSPRPLLSYQVAEDADTQSCAPSYELGLGTEKELPLIGAALEQGWDVVVPDYEGLESQYTGGVQAGHAVLDGIRAAESFSGAGLSGSATPVGLMGYSGGALASAWTSELQPTYAPGLNVKGVAEGGVPVNAGTIASKANGNVTSGIYFDAAVGLSRAFPSLIHMDELLNQQGEAMVSEISNECVETYVARWAFQRIETYTKGGLNPLNNAGVKQAIALDTLGQRRPAGPLFVYEAIPDELIPIEDVNHLTAKYCSEGVPVEYVKNELADHFTLAVSGAGAALNYLIARFEGEPAGNTCATGGRTVLSSLLEPNNAVTTLTSLAGLIGFL